MRQFRGVDPETLKAIQTMQRMANAWGDKPRPKKDSEPEPEAVKIQEDVVTVSSDDFIWRAEKFLKKLKAQPEKSGLIQSPQGDVTVSLRRPENVTPVLLNSHDLRAKGIHQTMIGIACGEVKLTKGSLFLMLQEEAPAIVAAANLATTNEHRMADDGSYGSTNGRLLDVMQQGGTLDQRIIRKPHRSLTTAFLKKAVADIADPSVFKTVYRGQSKAKLDAAAETPERRVWRPDAGFYVERVVKSWEEAAHCNVPCVIVEGHKERALADKVAIITGLDAEPTFDQAEFSKEAQNKMNTLELELIRGATDERQLSEMLKNLGRSERIRIIDDKIFGSFKETALVWQPDSEVEFQHVLTWDQSFGTRHSRCLELLGSEQPFAVKKSGSGGRKGNEIAFIVTPMSYDL